MRRILVALVLPAVLAVPAVAQQHWCAISSEGHQNCSFGALTDCRAAVLGNGGNCIPEAPVGHRQPGAVKSVSPPDAQLDALLERVNRKNDKLNLCKGC